MQRGNYRMLSQREWQFAKSESFMFTVPVQAAPRTTTSPNTEQLTRAPGPGSWPLAPSP